MDQNRLKNAVGLCMRAGGIVCGDFAVEKALKAGKVKLVLLDEKASEATKERYNGMCERAGVTCLVMEGMGASIGKSGGMIAAVRDARFVPMIQEAYGND